MNSYDSDTDQAFPVELQLRVLRYELEKLDEDLERLNERHAQVKADIARYEHYLNNVQRRTQLRLVK